MFNVCNGCGAYRPDKEIDVAGPFAICPVCGHAHPFRRLPLLLIGGASGAGKSTICQILSGRVTGAVLLDCDILWRPEFDTPQDNYRDFFETWLRLAKNIAQSGRPVVIFGAGFVVPDNVAPCVERRYFSRLYHLGLICNEETLAGRLRARPQWRQSSDPDTIAGHVAFNRWIGEAGKGPHAPIELIDSTADDPLATAAAVQAWIEAKLGGEVL
jgi:hypothetical protein